jgi:4-hydroxy-tetrahydrodipicolinate synthase
MDYADLRAQLCDVAVTTATPFTEDATAVDHDALAANLQFLEERGVSLFIPCGNTGEYYSLTREERVAVVETHVEALSADATVVAGLGGSTGTALAYVEAYEAAGADAVMVMHPDHTYAHARGLVEYYRAIADATDLGVTLYKRGPGVPRSVVCEAATWENVVAVKFADDDVLEFRRTVEEAAGAVTWLNGIAERYAPAFAVEGAEGLTTGVGNFAPEASLALFDALEARDFERAAEVRAAIQPYEELRDGTGPNSTLSAANNVPAVKYGLDLAGLHGGPVRAPLVGLSEDDRARAEECFERVASVSR